MDGTSGIPAPTPQKISDALVGYKADVDELIAEGQALIADKQDNEQVDKKNFDEMSPLQHLSGELETTLRLAQFVESEIESLLVRIRELTSG